MRRQKTTAKSLMVVLVSAVVATTYGFVAGWHLGRPDSKQYSAIAERLLATGEYQGTLLLPMGLATLDEKLPERTWPVSYCRAGFPLLLAGVFAMVGISELAYQITNILFFCLLAWAVYQLAQTLSEGKTGWYALALLLAVTPILTRGFYSGLEMPYMALVVLSALCLLRARSWAGAAAAGAVLSGAMFLRPSALLFLPLVLLAFADRKRARQLAISFVLSFLLLTAAGYLVESHLNPAPLNPQRPFNLLAYGLYRDTEAYPAEAIATRLLPPDWNMVSRHLPDVAEKFLRSLHRTSVPLAYVIPLWLVALVIWALATVADKAKLTWLALAGGLCALLVILGMSLTTPESLTRQILPATGLLIAVGAVGLQDVVRRSRLALPRWGHLATMLVLSALIFYSALFRWAEQAKIPNEPPGQQVAAYLEAFTSYDDVVVASYSIAGDVQWYGKRRCVVLPTDPQEAQVMLRRYVPTNLVIVGDYDNPEVFAVAEDLLPEYGLVDTFSLHTSTYDANYKLLHRAAVVGE